MNSVRSLPAAHSRLSPTPRAVQVGSRIKHETSGRGHRTKPTEQNPPRTFESVHPTPKTLNQLRKSGDNRLKPCHSSPPSQPACESVVGQGAHRTLAPLPAPPPSPPSSSPPAPQLSAPQALWSAAATLSGVAFRPPKAAIEMNVLATSCASRTHANGPNQTKTMHIYIGGNRERGALP